MNMRKDTSWFRQQGVASTWYLARTHGRLVERQATCALFPNLSFLNSKSTKSQQMNTFKSTMAFSQVPSLWPKAGQGCRFTEKRNQTTWTTKLNPTKKQ